MGLPTLGVVTRSELFGTGTTSWEVEHKGDSDTRAIAVFIEAFNANVTAVSALKYGEESLTSQEGAIKGESPFPYAELWFKDNVKTGTQILKGSKNTNEKVRVTVISLRSSAEVKVAAKAGTNSSGTSGTLAAMTSPTGGSLMLGLDTATAAPSSRSDTLLEQTNETTVVGDLQWNSNVPAGSKTVSWTYAATQKQARVGALFTGEPPSEAPKSKTLGMIV